MTSPPTSVAPAVDVRRAPATVAWVLGLLLASGLVLTVALPAIGTGWSQGWPWWVHGPVATVAYGTPAVLLLRRDPRSTMGWLLGLVAVLFLLTDASSAWAWRALVGTPGELPGGRTGGEVALWLAWSLWFLPFFLLPTVLLLLAPDGHVASPRWRLAVWASCVVVAASAVVNATAAYRTDPGADLTIPDQPLDVTNPLHSAWLQHWFGWVPVLLAPCIAAAVTSLLLRRHRASGLERRQLDVVVCGALATIGIALVAPFTPSPYYLVVVAVALAPYPVALGIAATRHRLWELDLVVRRSVVYGVVTLAVVAVYVVTIALLGGALGSRAGAPLVATAVVAVVAVPLFVRVQRAVDRRLYGDRSDPSAAVRRLADRWQAGERLPAPGATLTAMADDVADSLRLPHVRIVTASGLEGGTGSGSEPAARVPLRRGGLVLGELVASGREPGRAPSRRDVEALHEVAEYVAVVVHNLELSSDLQRSRERVVSAREEERRRLRRELHDGLGPDLAAIALQLETVRDLADGESGTESPAGALAESLRGHVRAVVADVRRIVDDLRPALLDDVGLEAALGQQAARLGTGELSIDVRLGALPPLTAATELAVLRIAGEAMTNAVRHSGATHCRVEVEVEDGLVEVLVADDGHGFVAPARGGVGIGSMRERAQEVGGSCTVESTPGRGTVVRALIPLPMEDGP